MTLRRPQDWSRHAACQGLTLPDRDLWSPSDDLTPAQRAGEYALARRICSTCPVRFPCAVDALARGEAHGMWGGLTEQDRRRVAYTHGYPIPGSAQHGTRSRYVAGCHDGPDGGACEDCLRAHRVYAAERRAIAREARIPIAEPYPWLDRPHGRGRWRAFLGQYVLIPDTIRSAA